jgi:uncharacterized protein YjbI with pentapeptide repeats
MISILLDMLLYQEFSFLKWSVFLVSPENSRTILGSLSQVQAAIFSIFLAVYSLVIQQHKSSPGVIRNLFADNILRLIVFMYVFSISIELILIKYVGIHSINLFWIFSLSLFEILILFPFMGNFLSKLSNNAIRIEVLGGSARLDLDGINLERFNLNNFDLKNRILRNANLIGVQLRKANLDGADATYALLTNADLSSASLCKANLSKSVLNYANFTRADLSEANMSEADLSDSNLFQANLINTKLTKSKLIETNLTQAILKKADLTNADVRGAKFDGADLDEATIVKIGFDESVLDAMLKANNIYKANLDEDLRERLMRREREINLSVDAKFYG